MNSHMHKYKFESKVSGGHTHRITGYTENTIGINMLHFHSFYGISSYNGHTHYYSGITGLPRKTAIGHIHKIEGILELNNLHEHEFINSTFEETAYLNDGAPNEAYV